MTQVHVDVEYGKTVKANRLEGWANPSPNTTGLPWDGNTEITAGERSDASIRFKIATRSIRNRTQLHEGAHIGAGCLVTERIACMLVENQVAMLARIEALVDPEGAAAKAAAAADKAQANAAQATAIAQKAVDQASGAAELNTEVAPILKKLDDIERRLKALEEKPAGGCCVIM